MTRNRKLTIIGIFGVLIFCIGASLRLQAHQLSLFEMRYDLQGVPLKPNANGQKSYMEDSNRKNAITDISLVLIWSGGGLLVLSLAGWFFSKDQDSTISEW